MQAIRFHFNTLFWKVLWVFHFSCFGKKLKSVLVTTNQLFCNGTLQQRLNISDLSKSTLLLMFPTSVKCWELSPIHLAVQCTEQGGQLDESKLHKHQNKMGSLSIATRKLQEELENQLHLRSCLLQPLFAVLLTWMQIIHNFITLVMNVLRLQKCFLWVSKCYMFFCTI